MNLARSLGPAVISGQLNSLWLYLLIAPTMGAILTALSRTVVFLDNSSS